MASRVRREPPSRGETSPFSSKFCPVGWPFGLTTCIEMQRPRPMEVAQPPENHNLHFLNMKTDFLLPYFSDASNTSSSDTDSRSETASSFFVDSRRITLASLIRLPMDNSFRANLRDNHYHVFVNRRKKYWPSCGILEILGCVRNMRGVEDLEDKPSGETDAVPNPTSLAECLELERSVSQGAHPSEKGCVSVMHEEALSIGSRSSEWTNNFVSCSSMLSDAESMEDDGGHESDRVATPSCLSVRSTPRKSRKSHRRTRSSSLRSFFSSFCCRLDAKDDENDICCSGV